MKTVNPSTMFDSLLRQTEINEDFHGAAPTGWATDGTATATAARGGVLSLASAATDNDAASVTLSAKEVVLADDKPIIFRARIQFAEAATNAANLFVGLFSGTITDAVGDDGAGPPSSYSGFGFYKVDGSLNWFVEASVGSTQQTVELTALNSLDGVAKPGATTAFQLLEIQVLPKTSTKCDVTFEIDGVTVAKFTDFVYTSVAAMAPVVSGKAGTAAAQTFLVDLIQVCQVR